MVKSDERKDFERVILLYKVLGYLQGALDQTPAKETAVVTVNGLIAMIEDG